MKLLDSRNVFGTPEAAKPAPKTNPEPFPNGYPSVRPELDLVESEDQVTHKYSLLDDEIDPETSLDIFEFDPNFLENEKQYEELKKSIVGEESEKEDGSDAKSDDKRKDKRSKSKIKQKQIL
ncbi:hypothetical protein Nepgr_033702 [Nepenthes gracilis]|uniref:Uncharacterized protein n=1 Tax=Nepenthes gracilis TaxID=150966 RepID=A0AAD3Y749_NEPGR|nr:hypothetical protein Nepgr_033702 [Nepenthes gracilis]